MQQHPTLTVLPALVLTVLLTAGLYGVLRSQHNAVSEAKVSMHVHLMYVLTGEYRVGDVYPSCDALDPLEAHHT